jgi:hypothetical protein
MDSGKDIQHYFHANASAWGGGLVYPVNTTLPVLAPTSLPSVGGYLQAEHTDFRIGDSISIDRAYSSVSGARNPHDGSFETMVTATIEGVNISNVLYAKEITMRLTTNHPSNDTSVTYFPTVSFPSVSYSGLRTNTCELTPEVDVSAFQTKGYPGQSWLYNPNLRQFASDQSKDFAAQAKKVAGKGMPVFDRLWKRHSNGGPNSTQSITDRGNIICTVVPKIKMTGRCDGATTVGNTLYVPNFGRIILGELIVDGNSFNLTMMRLDMGSGSTAKGSGPQGSANGTNTGGG